MILAPFLLKSSNIIHQNQCKKKVLEFERKLLLKLEEMKKLEERFNEAMEKTEKQMKSKFECLIEKRNKMMNNE